MKKNDYIMLAKRSLKQRKKETKSAVLGLAFGFIILIPMFIAIFGVNISMNEQMSKTPYLLNYNVGLADYRIETSDSYAIGDSFIADDNWSGSKHLDTLLEDKNSYNKIVYEAYGIPTFNSEFSSTRYSINGGEEVVANTQLFNHISIVDLDKSDSIFPKNLTEKISGGIFMAGYDQGFTDKGKKQIILTQDVLNSYGLTPDDVYMKNWSFLNRTSYNGVNEINYLCQNYKVVGIVKSEVSKLCENDDLMSSKMFFTSVNVYNEAGEGVLKPRLIKQSNGWQKYVYDNIAQKESLNQEYMMLSESNIFGAINATTYGATWVHFEADSFAKLNASMIKTDALAISALGDNLLSSPVRISNIIHRYKLIYQLVNIVSIVFILVGAIMLACALISLYSTIYHNVSQRKYYLTMMRAIGARDNVIPKLYLTECLIIASRANIFISIIGFALSSILKVVLDMVLKINGVSVAIAISWWMIVVRVLVAVIFLYAVTTLFAVICTRKLVKRKMTEVLSSK